MLRGDSVKDDSGACAVFTDQGSSASQMTAAKVMDVVARLLDCAGQAADAVSAWIEVKIVEHFESQSAQMCGHVFRDKVAQILVKR